LDEIADAPFPSESVGAGKVWSTKGRLKAAELPTTGKIRFVPRKGYEPSNPLARGSNNGFIDRFGNEWVRGPSRTQGQAFEWDVQLSKTGKQKIGWLTRDGSHANVSLGGKITHRYKHVS
jgi:filamentous hemagglutinin